MTKLAAGCVYIKNNSILLLHRIDKDWFELPGGKADPGEELEHTAIREFKEELGGDAHVIRKLGKTLFKSVEFELDYAWFLISVENEHNLKIGEPNSFDRYEFIHLDKLKKERLSTNMVNFLNDLESGKIIL